MQDINRGKLAALLTAVEQGSTLTKSTICTIAGEILKSEPYEEADWPMPAPESGEEPSDPPAPRLRRASRSDIVAYGRDLAKDGALGIREIITGVMERFGLSNVAMARALGISHSTLSKYLRHGRCRRAVVTAATTLWGDENGGTPKSTRSPAQPGEAAQTLPTATFGGKDQSDRSDKSDN